VREAVYSSQLKELKLAYKDKFDTKEFEGKLDAILKMRENS